MPTRVTYVLSGMTHMHVRTEPLYFGLFILALGIVFGLLVLLTIRILFIHRLYTQKNVFLELTPLANSVRAPAAMEQLFAVLHGLQLSRSFLDKLFCRSVVFTPMIVSSRDGGIRYVISVAEKDGHIFEHDVAAFAPELKFQKVDDRLMRITARQRKRILEFKQANEYAYPLKISKSQREDVAGSYLIGAMTKLKPNETVAFQLVTVPARVQRARRLMRRIANNEELLFSLSKRRSIVTRSLLSGINSALFAISGGIGEVFHGPSEYHAQLVTHSVNRERDIAQHLYPARTLSSFEQQLAESVHSKLTRPLFYVNIRVMIISEHKVDLKKRADLIRNALQSFSVPEYQSLKTRHTLFARYKELAFNHCLPSMAKRRACILSAQELADIYHFSSAQRLKTENIVQSLARSLPAPTSLKHDLGFDIIFGRNYHHGQSTDIGLTSTERERHMYILGGTGNGKTTLMQYAIIQDIKNGKGVAVIDPHGDLSETILKYIPEERMDDVIYFNPDDVSHPIGLNLLEIPEGLSPDEALKAQDFATEAIVSIFRKLFSKDDSGGHRIENTLRYAVHTAFHVPGATLFTVKKLLIDPSFRSTIVDKIEDGDIKDYWQHEFSLAGNYQKYKKIDGVTTKIGRFQRSVFARRCLEQSKSTIDFDDILNGKILICNLAKGHIIDDTSEMFGTAILAKLHLAAYRRIQIPEAERKPFYVYVDEFQNFATPLFVQILSEARKYKLFISMAEQSTSQQEPEIVENILGNAGIVCCFRTENPKDEQYMLHIMRGHINPGEITNLSAYSFYMKIVARHAQEPFSGETLLPENSGSDFAAGRAIAASRTNYAITYQQKTSISAKEKTTVHKGKLKPAGLNVPGSDVSNGK